MSGFTYHICLVMLTIVFCARCFMALIRGVNSHFPCPVCLVPNAQMSDGSIHLPRTSESMKEVYNKAAEYGSKKEQEEHLKKYGLRNVEV